MVVEIVSAYFALIPVALFVSLLIVSFGFWCKGKKFHEVVSKFFLRAAGWSGAGQVEFSPAWVRWGAGLAFVACYGFFLVVPLGVIFHFHSLMVISSFILSLVVSFFFFGIFIVSLFSCAACDDDGVVFIPLNWGEGKKLSKLSVESVVLKKRGLACIVYSSSWSSGQLFLLRKEQLENVLDCQKQS